LTGKQGMIGLAGTLTNLNEIFKAITNKASFFISFFNIICSSFLQEICKFNEKFTKKKKCIEKGKQIFFNLNRIFGIKLDGV
jgi:hypothetical protein